jgi:hypothetical protein
MTKNELFCLIDGDIPKFFEELNGTFLGKNPVFKDLSDEYVSQSNNFSLPKFRSRLKVFVTTKFIETKSEKKNVKKEVEIDDLLHDLDFKPQSTHFKNSYDAKNVSAVLLHGENDQEGNDLKWLCRQLLKTEGLMHSRRIHIDFTGPTWSNFENMLSELYEKLDSDEKDDEKKDKIEPKHNVMRSRIEERLKEDNLVVLMKNTKKVNDLGMFYKLFNDFFSYLYREWDGVFFGNSLIFILIEDNTEGYREYLDGKYFLWFEEDIRVRYNLIIKKNNEAKIIDLAPVENVQAHLIEEWINDKLSHTEIENALSCYIGKIQSLLEEKSNRYNVIQKICSKLKIDETEINKWLKY